MSADFSYVPTQAGTFIVVIKSELVVRDFTPGEIIIRHEVSSQESLILRTVRHIRSRVEGGVSKVKYQEVEAIWEVSFLG